MFSRAPFNLSKTAFLLWWLAANTGGWAIVLPLAARLYTALAGSFFSDASSYSWFFIAGAIMALAQALVLWQRFSIPWYQWLITSTFGYGIGFIGMIWAALLDRYLIIPFPAGPLLEWDPLIGGLLHGMAVGCCQSLVWGFPRWRVVLGWIVANAVGWSLGLFLADVLAFLLPDIGPGRAWPSFLALIISGVWFSVVTGLALVWLVKEDGGRSILSEADRR